MHRLYVPPFANVGTGAGLQEYSDYYLKMDLYIQYIFLNLGNSLFLSKEIVIINGHFLKIIPLHPCEKQHQTGVSTVVPLHCWYP